MTIRGSGTSACFVAFLQNKGQDAKKKWAFQIFNNSYSQRQRDAPYEQGSDCDLRWFKPI